MKLIVKNKKSQNYRFNYQMKRKKKTKKDYKIQKYQKNSQMINKI